MSNDQTAEINPAIDWDAPVEDPIVAEIQRTRAALATEFGGDRKLQNAARRVKNWACSLSEVTLDRHSPLEPELPEDLTILIPDSERFIEHVRMWRSIEGKHKPDLDAYNEDARYRARVLGLPEESFVVHPSDFTPDWNEHVWDEEGNEQPTSASVG